MNVPVKQEGISYKSVPIAPHGGGGMLMPQNFGEVVAFAEIMSRSQHAIPKHLRDVPGACLAVAMQAMRWEMDPFAVASKSYNVKDIIAYEAQLIAAVVHTRAPLKTRPVYAFAGEGPDRRCTVTAMFDDGIERSYESPRIADIKVKNSPLWTGDPDQQQGYYSIRAFGRRYCPEVLLGVYTPEEADSFRGPEHARDVTPRGATVPFSQRIAEIDGAKPQNTEAQREAGDTTLSPASPASERGSASADSAGVQDRCESTPAPNASVKADAEAATGNQASAASLNSSQGAAVPHTPPETKPAPEGSPELTGAGATSSAPNAGSARSGDPKQATESGNAALDGSAGLPPGWERSYSAALGRAQKIGSLSKYAAEFWKDYGTYAAIKTSPHFDTAEAIYAAFRDHFGPAGEEARNVILRELSAI